MSDEEKESEGDSPELSALITLKQAAKLVELSYSHLRLLARERRIWAIRVGHEWLTTRQAVEDYLRQGNKPGPKPLENPPDSHEGD